MIERNININFGNLTIEGSVSVSDGCLAWSIGFSDVVRRSSSQVVSSGMISWGSSANPESDDLLGAYGAGVGTNVSLTTETSLNDGEGVIQGTLLLGSSDLSTTEIFDDIGDIGSISGMTNSIVSQEFLLQSAFGSEEFVDFAGSSFTPVGELNGSNLA